MYEYKATVVRVIDADTIDVDFDLGFYVTLRGRVRFSYLDAPEIRTDDGKKAKLFVEQWFAANPVVVIRTQKDKHDSFGRWLGEILPLNEGVSLNKLMLSLGLAKSYS